MKLTEEQKEKLIKELKIVWNDEKMVNHCLKSSKYIYYNNVFIECCDSKPSIKKDIYYNDETEPPILTLDYFISYNMKHELKLLDTKKLYYTGQQYTCNKPNNLKGIREFYYDDIIPNGYIKMNDELINIINNAILETREDYKKRLISYYKRYFNNIYITGYWANR